MKSPGSMSVAIVALLLGCAASVSAQIGTLGHNGYVTYPAILDHGFSVMGGYARGHSGGVGSHCVNGRVELAAPFINLWGGVGWLSANDETAFPVSGGDALHIKRGRIGLSLQATASHVSDGDHSTLALPFGPVLVLGSESGSRGMRFWIMPLAEMVRVRQAAPHTDWGLGLSAGSDFAVARRLGIYIAVDFKWSYVAEDYGWGDNERMVVVGFGVRRELDAGPR